MKRSLTILILLIAGAGAFLKTTKKNGIGVEVSEKLWVWKPSNLELRTAIRDNPEFDDIRMLGVVESDSIRFMVNLDSEFKALEKLQKVSDFAVEWGKKFENQSVHFSDGAQRMDGSFEYEESRCNTVSRYSRKLDDNKME